MCDTALATPDRTASGRMIFGKNSDRQRNEAQFVEQVSGGIHAPEAVVRCTYIEIPQAWKTYDIVISRPYWIWGAEMGANEHGVVIGNEGLHARSPAPEEPALLGMDLLRLALERAGSAAEAIDIITTLLARHGQGGNGGHLTPTYYNNGFMVADAQDAFVLETIDREWIVEAVTGSRAISNQYSIAVPTTTSRGMADRVRREGWADGMPANFAATIGNPNREHIGQSGTRSARSRDLLAQPGVDVFAMMSLLRDHGPDEDQRNDPRTAAARSVCMHATTLDRAGQTTAAMVSELGSDPVHWLTEGAATCLSIFKPALFRADMPRSPKPSGRFDAASSWWRHERFHRQALLCDLPAFLADFGPARDALEEAMHARIADVEGVDDHDVRSVAVATCWFEAEAFEDCWRDRLKSYAGTKIAEDYRSAWGEFSRIAQLDIGGTSHET